MIVGISVVSGGGRGSVCKCMCVVSGSGDAWAFVLGFENSKIKIKDFFSALPPSFPFCQIVDLELKVRIHWRIWSK